MVPEYADDTEGIRKVYEYIVKTASDSEHEGKLFTDDVSYIMGALQMWLVDHEPLPEKPKPLYPPEQPQDSWNPFKRKAQ